MVGRKNLDKKGIFANCEKWKLPPDWPFFQTNLNIPYYACPRCPRWSVFQQNFKHTHIFMHEKPFFLLSYGGMLQCFIIDYDLSPLTINCISYAIVAIIILMFPSDLVKSLRMFVWFSLSVPALMTHFHYQQELGKRVCITTDSLSRIRIVLFVKSYFVFGFLSCCCGEYKK